MHRKTTSSFSAFVPQWEQVLRIVYAFNSDDAVKE